jgi:predicted nucleic acid-binding protein
VILLDTSILVYAVGVEHPLREACRQVVGAVGEGRLTATTTVEVLQEFADVRARRRSRADAVSLVERYAALLAPLITVDADDLALGMREFREHAQLGAFDAVLAAVAQRREHVRGLASADAAFSGIPTLVHLNPADDDFAVRLGIA